MKSEQSQSYIIFFKSEVMIGTFFNAVIMQIYNIRSACVQNKVGLFRS